jgi:hypothetical protein
MKTKRTCLKFLILSVLMAVMLTNIVFPQGTDSRLRYGNNEQFGFGIVLTPQKTSINMDGFSNTATITGGSGINIAFDASFYFSTFAGISIGAGLSPYSSQVSLSSYTTQFSDIDSESESFEMQIEGRSITEDQKISLLSIPITLTLRVPAGSKLGFYVNAGINAGIPIVKTYDGSGIFSYDGYYEEYPVTLENIPQYGFPSDLRTEVSDQLEIKSFVASLTASGGLYFYINKSIQLSLGANYTRALSDISNYQSTGTYYLTTEAEELNSMMEGSDKTGIQAMGISLGIRYFIK